MPRRELSLEKPLQLSPLSCPSVPAKVDMVTVDPMTRRGSPWGQTDMPSDGAHRPPSLRPICVHRVHGGPSGVTGRTVAPRLRTV